jgi:hypothetical protein
MEIPMGQTNEAAAVAEYLDDMVLQLALMARAHGLAARAELLEQYSHEVTGSGETEAETNRLRA